MNRNELIQVAQNLQKLEHLKGIKFSYCLMKNRKKIESELKAIEEVSKQMQEELAGYKEYDNKRLALCEQYADKDEQGNAIKDGDTYRISDRDEFNKELSKLIEEHKQDLEQFGKLNDEFEKFLRDDVQIEFHMIDVDELPNDITPALINIIREFIK